MFNEPPAVIVAVGKAFTTTVVAADVAVHPELFATCTVYEPAVDTVMLALVAPLLHK